MTYAAYETSEQGGHVAELYTWLIGGQTLLETSHDVAVSIGSDTWNSVQLDRVRIERNAETVRRELRISVPRDHTVAGLFVPGPCFTPVALTIARVHLDDPDLETRTIWPAGRVLSGSWEGEGRISLLSESTRSSVERPGLGAVWSRNCQHVWASQGRSQCGVNSATYTVSRTVVSGSGVTLTLNTGVPGIGYWGVTGAAVGYVTYTDSRGYPQRRNFRSISGAVFTLDYPLTFFTGVTAVTITAGCDQSLPTCTTNYANQANYGGVPKLPTRDIYDGQQIF